MRQVSVLALYVLLCYPFSASGGGVGPDCTRGFMTLQRIHMLNEYNTKVASFSGRDSINIFPGMNFTCNGTIRSWTLGFISGAVWDEFRIGFSYTVTAELQIWRSSGNGTYTKVGSTIITTQENTTQLYEYPLPSPLPFQEGDCVGFYLPYGSKRLQFQYNNGYRRYTHTMYWADYIDRSTSHLHFRETTNQVYPLVSVETDPPGCGNGFMSMERMKILLGLDTAGYATFIEGRQQITPDMKFTCDGMITKWIVGTNRWTEGTSRLPELQLWRMNSNNTYKKISGTVITYGRQIGWDVFEYDNFPPVPFQAGDILGVFVPQIMNRLGSEKGYGPTNYYFETGRDVTISPYETIHLDQTNTQLQSDVNHLLVTVEISIESSCTVISTSNPTAMSSATAAITDTTVSTPAADTASTVMSTSNPTAMSSATAAITDTTVSTAPPDVTTHTGSTVMSTSNPTAVSSPDTGSHSSVGVGVGVGVGAAVVLLVVVGVLGVALFCVWRRRNTSKMMLPAILANRPYRKILFV